MPSSCGQPIILSVITMDLAPAASINASTSSATPASLRISAPSETHRLRSVASACSAVNNADRELCCRPIVRAIESDGSYGVAAKSSLSSLAQPLARTLIHLLVAARRQLLEALGDRVQTFYRSRTVP